MLGTWGSELGFGCGNFHKQHCRTSRVQLSKSGFRIVPQTDWACPPRFLVNPDWKIEAGSESQETRIQQQRELRNVEAIYYHKSDIPPNPYVASNTLDFNDCSRIPVIPLDIVTVDPSSVDPSPDDMSLDDPSISPGPSLKVGGKPTEPLLERNEVIRIAVALVALIKSEQLGSQIDLELLIQLLCNPGMLDQLVKQHGVSANQSSEITNAQLHECSSAPSAIPTPAGVVYRPWLSSAPFSHSLSRGVKDMIEHIHSNSVSKNPSLTDKVDMGEVRKLINEYGVQLCDDRVKPRPVAVKDADYYRRLILVHGLSQENDKPQGYVKPIRSREPRPYRNGTAPDSQFVVSGRTYKRGYYLADGGYPNWSTFVKAISYPAIPKEKKFSKLQMGARKDVERAFGSLKGRWGILNRTMRSTTKMKLSNIVNTCLILHNMMLKEDGLAISPVHIRDPPVNPVFKENALHELHDDHMCLRLRYDLIEHIDAQNLPYLEEDRV